MTIKEYGLLTTYINGTASESIYDNEQEREAEFEQWKNADWHGIVVYKNSIVNLANVIRLEKFER